MPDLLLTSDEAAFGAAVARLNRCNPFLPERIEHEREALGAAFVEAGAAWNVLAPTAARHPNLVALVERSEVWIEQVRARWPSAGRLRRETNLMYEEVVLFWLFHRYCPAFDRVILAALDARAAEARVEFFPAFRQEAESRLRLPGLTLLDELSIEHVFATCFQVRRAFHHIYRSLVGRSAPMARLRAAIWQSIFTHDLDRYRRVLHARMGDFATLVTGPSGTGKELVARAIALSRYVPFEPRRGGFTEDLAGGFFALNLSALSPTLIESELFGHRRGSFTGATGDRAGWMETCSASGAVFLDEIGDVDGGIQVKLLRVLQTRTFQRIGDTEPRRFAGKVIAATHQNLPELIRAGRFREDFYYRLCSDQVSTPSLREQLDACPEDLAGMVEFVAARLLGADEGAAFAPRASAWIDRHLGPAYAWPGNFRELEQCVRNLLVRGSYHPAELGAPAAPGDWWARAQRGALTAEELLGHYTQFVYAQAGTIEETARRLDLDRRTVKARLRRPL